MGRQVAATGSPMLTVGSVGMLGLPLDPSQQQSGMSVAVPVPASMQ
jgi:hypothetical protein